MTSSYVALKPTQQITLFLHRNNKKVYRCEYLGDKGACHTQFRLYVIQACHLLTTLEWKPSQDKK